MENTCPAAPGFCEREEFHRAASRSRREGCFALNGQGLHARRWSEVFIMKRLGIKFWGMLLNIPDFVGLQWKFMTLFTKQVSMEEMPLVAAPLTPRFRLNFGPVDPCQRSSMINQAVGSLIFLMSNIHVAIPMLNSITTLSFPTLGWGRFEFLKRWHRNTQIAPWISPNVFLRQLGGIPILKQFVLKR